jgi:type IV pilus assembly protein PilC
MQIDTSSIFRKSDKVTHEIKGKSQSIFNKNISISFLSNKNQIKNRFFSETAVLLSSGMDLKKSLEIVLSGITKENEKHAIENILRVIIKGSSLSKAMEKSKAFSTYDYFSVKIGEESGSLPSVLKELANYYSKRISQQRQISGALTYPLLVLFTTILSLVFMLNFIVPMFEDVFLRFKGGLPPITRAVIALSDSFSKYSLFFLILMISFLIVISLNRKKEWFRKISSAILINTPIAGPIIKLTYKTRFCQTLKLLLSSKVHLLEAIGLIRQMIGFYPLEIALQEIKSKLAHGVTLSEAMESYPIFDKKLIAMTRVAEEVNKLDVVYEQLFEQYSDELDTKIKTMNNLLEPILIIFVGGLVALILISMYMPIFQIGTNIY